MKIIIRADSGSIMGSGHIMRCLVLADELNSTTIFACRNLAGNIASVIESRGYKVKRLPESLPEAEKDFLSFLKTEKPDILIIDNYDTDIELEKKARKLAGSIIVIDDLANRKHDCDILLDQNPCPAIHKKYTKLVPKSAIRLLGLKYALLGKEFGGYRKHHCEESAAGSTTRQSIFSWLAKKWIASLHSFRSGPLNDKIKNIIIFFGGGDHKNLTQKTIEALIKNPPSYKGINFNVVVGNSNPNKDKIQELCKTQKNFTFHCQINNMAELMQKSDLFIGAGGTTSWERMCIGLPGIIISIAENQEEICHELANMDVIKYLGTAEEFTSTKLLGAMEWIKESPEWVNKAATQGQEMVDGSGTKRVAAIIKSLSITFRKAKKDDCKNIFKWRNAEENRRYSINNEEIPYSDHEKWFTKIIKDKSHVLLIASYNENPLGVVRFDFTKNSTEISLYLIPGQHGKGFGLPLLMAAENWLKINHPDIIETKAKVILENIASVKIFEYALYSIKESDKNIALFNKRTK